MEPTLWECVWDCNSLSNNLFGNVFEETFLFNIYAMATINYMTEEGLDQLKIEIRRLRQKEGLRWLK